MSTGGGLKKSWIAKSFFRWSGALPRGACSGGTVESRNQARLTLRPQCRRSPARPPTTQSDEPPRSLVVTVLIECGVRIFRASEGLQNIEKTEQLEY
jgi:hypothetical protein